MHKNACLLVVVVGFFLLLHRSMCKWSFMCVFRRLKSGCQQREKQNENEGKTKRKIYTFIFACKNLLDKAYVRVGGDVGQFFS